MNAKIVAKTVDPCRTGASWRHDRTRGVDFSRSRLLRAAYRQISHNGFGGRGKHAFVAIEAFAAPLAGASPMSNCLRRPIYVTANGPGVRLTPGHSSARGRDRSDRIFRSRTGY